MLTADPSCSLSDHRRCLLLLRLPSAGVAAADTEEVAGFLTQLRASAERRHRDAATSTCLWPKVVTRFQPDAEQWAAFQCHRRLLMAVCVQPDGAAPDWLAEATADFKAAGADPLVGTLPSVRCQADAMDRLVSDLVARLAARLTADAATGGDSSPTSEATPTSTPTPLPTAPVEASELAGWSDGKRAKRAAARREKQRADLRLLLGELRPARAAYKAAAETLRGLNDWLWYGAALEGVSAVAEAAADDEEAAAAVESSSSSSSTEDTAARCRDALAEYCKFSGAVGLAAEAALKTARVLGGTAAGCQFVESPQTSRLLADGVGGGGGVWCVGDLLAELGLARRAALHRWMAAHRLLVAAGIVDVNDNADVADSGHVDDKADAAVDGAVALLSRCLDDAGGGASSPRLRVILTVRLVDLLARRRRRHSRRRRSPSRLDADPADAAVRRRALTALGDLGPWMTPDECRRLLDRLIEDCDGDSATSVSSPTPATLPEWLSVRPESMPDPPVPTAAAATTPTLTASGGGGKPLFIFTPLKLHDQSGKPAPPPPPVYWAVGEANRVSLAVRCRLPVPLRLWRPRLVVKFNGDTKVEEDHDAAACGGLDGSLDADAVWPLSDLPADGGEGGRQFVDLPPIGDGGGGDGSHADCRKSTLLLTATVHPDRVGWATLIGVDYSLVVDGPGGSVRRPSSFRCRLPDSVRVRVAPPLPGLRLEWLGGCDTARLEVDAATGRCCGGVASLQLQLTNATKATATATPPSIGSVRLEALPGGLATWSADNLARQLPLKSPGDVAAVTLYFRGGSGSGGSNSGKSDATWEAPDLGRHRLRLRVRYAADEEAPLGRLVTLDGHVIVSRRGCEADARRELNADPAVDVADATGEWLADKLAWTCRCGDAEADSGHAANNGNSPPAPRRLRLLPGQLRSISVEARYHGNRTLPGPVLLVWPEQAGLLLSGQTATQLPELSPRGHRSIRLSSGVLLLPLPAEGEGEPKVRPPSQLVATLFFPSTNVKVTMAWPVDVGRD